MNVCPQSATKARTARGQCRVESGMPFPKGLALEIDSHFLLLLHWVCHRASPTAIKAKGRLGEYILTGVLGTAIKLPLQERKEQMLSAETTALPALIHLKVQDSWTGPQTAAQQGAGQKHCLW